MPKLAIFVEGLTERLLVERIITEIANRRHIRIRVDGLKGKLGDRRVYLVSEDADLGQPGFILIRDCHGDHNVASDIRDQYSSLVHASYDAIIGLRDLYPNARQDLQTLLGVSKRSINFGLRTNPIKVKWVLAVMEIEAWFLAEHTHFIRLHTDLTPEKIRIELGFDPVGDDMEMRPHPAEDLRAAYSLVGLDYIKTLEDITRTVLALDIALLYANMFHVIQLRLLVDAIDEFIAMCTSVPPRE